MIRNKEANCDIFNNADLIAAGLAPFCLRLGRGRIAQYEHAALRWLPPDELPTLDCAEADLSSIADYCREQRHSEPV